MDLKLAISLLAISILSIISFTYYLIKELRELKKCNVRLRTDILTNTGADINTLNSDIETCFAVSEKANNAGPNHCDIEFDSDLHTLNKRTYNHEFISTFAKDRI